MFKRTYHDRRRSLRFERLELRQLLAGDTYLVNFQNDEASPPTHYLVDKGQVFGDRGNGLSYGWSSDHADRAHERSATPDQRLDTLIQIEAGQSWELALDNGLYDVMVAVGDSANNDGVHTINVEGVSFWNAVPDTDVPLVKTMQVTVADGRLTIDQGGGADLATRINFVHVVGLSDGSNAAPAPPTITEPSTEGQTVNPADVHMEAVGFSDPEGDTHKSTDWEIWTVGPGAQPVWQTLGIEGVEKLHTHLGDGVFINSQAGEIALAANMDYELRVRFRDDTGSVSEYATRTFHTGPASTTFPLQIEDVAANPTPTWVDVFGTAVDLPAGLAILSPSDNIIAIDLDGGSESPAGETPDNAVDGTLAKYLNFGEINSGFIVTPAAGKSIVTGFRITTANDAEVRDPTAWALYGTNDPIASSNNSTGTQENWAVIDSGSVALPSARNAIGPSVVVNGITPYASYRMIFTGVKDSGAANSMQIAEIQFLGEIVTPSTVPILSAADQIRAIDLDGGSSYPDSENPPNAIDGTFDKYLNFGKINSGFIVTPAVGASTVTGFQITTANDSPARDPTTWVLYGTNNSITSGDNSTGMQENWILIDFGSVALPNGRNTTGPLVSVDNTLAYTSYRMVFTGVKDAGAANSMQIAEIQFFGDGSGGGTPAPASLQITSGDTGDVLLDITGSESPGNTVTDFPGLGEHAHVKFVVSAGSRSLSLNQSNLTFADDDGLEHTVFLPAIDLAADEQLFLWVSSSGSTYYGTESQVEPDFSTVARLASLNVPYIVNRPGFVIEEVGGDYRLPVNIAFVPNPGPNPDDPLYFVTELYGSIQVVTRDGTKHEFATGLLDYNPQGPISGSGEQGLTGITVVRDVTDPDIYHLYVGMLWDNGSPTGEAFHYPKIERIDSAPGGLSLATRTVLLNLQPETQGQSHQISNISIGPDGKLYVHVGDGFDASTALDLDQFRGKILRLNLDGTAASDNPFYNAADGINARDYIYAYGFRNPFGGVWRASDGKHYEVENGPSVDRLAQVNQGVNYGWNGSDQSMATHAIYNWSPAHAPVNITFIQQETFNGSQFPAGMLDHAFVSESGPTYAPGPQTNGKRIAEFTLAADGTLLSGPSSFVEYVGSGQGRSTVVGLTAGPDGLYFTELYEETGVGGATGSGARIFRVRYVNSLHGDYDIDGDVDQDDYSVWKSTFGSNLLLAADGNGDGVVDSADYTVWRNNLGASLPAATEGAAALQTDASSDEMPNAGPISSASVDAPPPSSPTRSVRVSSISTDDLLYSAAQRSARQETYHAHRSLRQPTSRNTSLDELLLVDGIRNDDLPTRYRSSTDARDTAFAHHTQQNLIDSSKLTLDDYRLNDEM